MMASLNALHVTRGEQWVRLADDAVMEQDLPHSRQPSSPPAPHPGEQRCTAAPVADLLHQHCNTDLLPIPYQFPNLKKEPLGWTRARLLWLGWQAVIKGSPMPTIQILLQALPKINSEEEFQWE